MTTRLHVLTILVVLVLAALTQAQTFVDLYSFTGASGAYSYAGVIEDSSANLYGTASKGGSYSYGVVFWVSSSGTETALYNFTGSTDGGYPFTPLIRDSKGNIYGTTAGGGFYDAGTVFKIDTAGKETSLYSFTGGSDGCFPWQGLAMDQKGSLYGTANWCGSYTAGTIFKVDSAGNFTLLHTFTGGPSDGAYPSLGHLIMDKAGNLYGVAQFGGASDEGVLYELNKSRTFTVLHSFAGGLSDGCQPSGTVLRDKSGNFYGTTEECGSSNYGTIWRVSKKDKEIILHNFAGGPNDGCYPRGAALDANGNLYGGAGCGANNDGAIYKLSTKATLTLLHSFDKSDGWAPLGEVLLTSKGTLFGTTVEGGGNNCSGYGCGTVRSYVP